jgi:hypothetical protein
MRSVPCSPPVLPPVLSVPLPHPALYCTVRPAVALYFQELTSEPSVCRLSHVPFCTVLATAVHCGPQMHSLCAVVGPCQPIRAFCRCVGAQNSPHSTRTECELLVSIRAVPIATSVSRQRAQQMLCRARCSGSLCMQSYALALYCCTALLGQTIAAASLYNSYLDVCISVCSIEQVAHVRQVYDKVAALMQNKLKIIVAHILAPVLHWSEPGH